MEKCLLGDMFYIKHGSDNFTVIDCCLSDDDDKNRILREIQTESFFKGVTHFISTHPDQDHIRGLIDLDDTIGIRNFYCVNNEAIKTDPTADFERYCSLRDHERKAFHLWRGRSRKWMNRKDKTRLPNTSNAFYEDALEEAKLATVQITFRRS